MANVTIKLNGKDFLLSCEDGQEEHLEELSIRLDEKFNELKKNLGNIGESKLLLITSIKVMDEYYDTKKNMELKKKEISEIKDKFKQLKALVYEYKEKKEFQINELENTQLSLKKRIEQDKNNYDQLIDNTAVQIEKFLEKVEKKKKI